MRKAKTDLRYYLLMPLLLGLLASCSASANDRAANQGQSVVTVYKSPT